MRGSPNRGPSGPLLYCMALWAARALSEGSSGQGCKFREKCRAFSAGVQCRDLEGSCSGGQRRALRGVAVLQRSRGLSMLHPTESLTAMLHPLDGPQATWAHQDMGDDLPYILLPPAESGATEAGPGRVAGGGDTLQTFATGSSSLGRVGWSSPRARGDSAATVVAARSARMVSAEGNTPKGLTSARIAIVEGRTSSAEGGRTHGRSARTASTEGHKPKSPGSTPRVQLSPRAPVSPGRDRGGAVGGTNGLAGGWMPGAKARTGPASPQTAAARRLVAPPPLRVGHDSDADGWDGDWASAGLSGGMSWADEEEDDPDASVEDDRDVSEKDDLDASVAGADPSWQPTASFFVSFLVSKVSRGPTALFFVRFLVLYSGMAAHSTNACS